MLMEMARDMNDFEQRMIQNTDLALHPAGMFTKICIDINVYTF